MKYFEGLKYVLIFEVGCWMVDVEFEILKVRTANFNPQTGTHKINFFSLINFRCYYKNTSCSNYQEIIHLQKSISFL